MGDSDDVSKRIGKRLALFRMETSFLVESFRNDNHTHYNMICKHDRKILSQIKIERFGRKGRDVGQFEDAKDVTYVSHGRTLVTDLIASRIQMCSKTGRSLMMFKGEEITEPWATALTKDGQIAVTSCRNKCVQILSEAGDILNTFGSNFFRQPSGVAVDQKQNYIVADSLANRVSIHNQKGEFLYYLGFMDNSDKSFHSPRYVCCSETGDVIVSDSGNHCIKIFESRSKLSKTIGGFGKGKYQFKFPYGVCSNHHGDIFVADHYNRRVAMFDNDGEFICHLMTPSIGLQHPQGLAISPELDLYVTHGDLKATEILTIKLSEPCDH